MNWQQYQPLRILALLILIPDLLFDHLLSVLQYKRRLKRREKRSKEQVWIAYNVFGD